MVVKWTRETPNDKLPWPINWEGVKLLCAHEKCVNKAYPDWPGRVPTIGWGETDGVTLDMEWTDEQCDQRLLQSLEEYTAAVREMCTHEPTSNQLAALVVCAYNIGLPAMSRSSMMKLHNKAQHSSAARAFALWNKATDKATGKKIEVDELTARRAAEAALYLKPDPGTPQFTSPQAVEPQPSLMQSPTMQTSTVAAGTSGALLLFSSIREWGDKIADTAKDWAADLGMTPLQVVGVLVFVGACVLIYRRLRQRAKGMA